MKSLEKPFSEGASLWIIPDIENSKWAQKLDWYLNFQLRRASQHRLKKISESNQEKIASWGVDLSKLIAPTKAKGPLMISSARLLPNQWTVQIALTNLEAWVQECVKLMTGLKLSTARVFLPSEISIEDFNKAVKSEKDFSFEVVDEASLV